MRSISNVVSMKFPGDQIKEWIAYQHGNFKKEVILLNLNQNFEQKLDSISNYEFNHDGSMFVYKKMIGADSLSKYDVKVKDLTSGQKDFLVFSNLNEGTSEMLNYQFNNNGNQLVLNIQQRHGQVLNNEIWLYTKGSNKIVVLANNGTVGIDSGLFISNTPPFFSKDDRYVYIKLKRKTEQHTQNNIHSAKVDIWSYKDSVQQSTQIFQQTFPDEIEYGAVISLQTKRVIALEKITREWRFILSIEGIL